jgi:hypothetical protein
VQRPKERRLWFGEIEPGCPVFTLKDDHLAIIYRRDVGSWRRRVKASPVPFGSGRQRPAKQNHTSPTLVNFHFDFLLADEREEMRRRDQRSADRKAPAPEGGRKDQLLESPDSK